MIKNDSDKSKIRHYKRIQKFKKEETEHTNRISLMKKITNKVKFPFS
jgi:hypothetical protein